MKIYLIYYEYRKSGEFEFDGAFTSKENALKKIKKTLKMNPSLTRAELQTIDGKHGNCICIELINNKMALY